ncbi:hypothetical protein LCGC14_1685200 [marine sediment metagenome]|uniref:Uncharacterized protein n=1 Tax=marine sediment metagenome TaxID=412755 RepID=A0A0F9KMG9_9ZZZZ
MNSRTSNIRDLKNAQGSAEWYTPSKYIEAARSVMGGINLDPASCAEANKIVKADRFFTVEDDGLLQKWHTFALWLNAPGSTKRGVSNQAIWQRQLISAYRAGHVRQAILLIFNSSGTETQWFQELLGRYPLCLTDHRIKFIPPEGVYENTKKNAPVHGNAFVYFGNRPYVFSSVFQQFGKIIPAWETDGLRVPE